MIYLDNAATTKPLPQVLDAVKDCIDNHWGNPSSLYDLGTDAKAIIDNARKVIADFIGAKPKEIIFTSGACESNSMAINGLIGFNDKSTSSDWRLITTKIEHKSIMNLAHDLPIKKVTFLSVDSNGIIDIDELKTRLTKIHSKNSDCAIYVSIQWANNEIGTIQDIAEISKVVHEYNGILHVDATQIIPDRPIDVKYVDLLSFSGQKLGATKGIGILYKSSHLMNLSPIIYGSQENSLRGGTENVPYIDGLRVAIEQMNYPTSDIEKRFTERVLGEINGTTLVGLPIESQFRLKTNVSICFDGVQGEMVLYMLSRKGIYVSTGSACNSGSQQPSYVLKAIGLSTTEANSVVRFTFNSTITNNDVDYVIKNLKYIVETLRTINN